MTTQPEARATRLQVRTMVQRVGARIQSVGIRIPKALDEVRRGTSGSVTNILLGVLERALGKPSVGRLQLAWAGTSAPAFPAIDLSADAPLTRRP